MLLLYITSSRALDLLAPGVAEQARDSAERRPSQSTPKPLRRSQRTKIIEKRGLEDLLRVSS